MSIKQVIVVRDDLKIGKGKLSAHVAHASLEGYKLAKAKDFHLVEEWEHAGQKKIVVRAKDERELLDLQSKCRSFGIPCVLIRDAGLTQVAPGTITALALGPWKEGDIDEITRHLRLL
ncbi:MAG: peptidyl-tRNA hydrolase Pth2 [Candidatus Micrarchaeia archaeon]